MEQMISRVKISHADFIRAIDVYISFGLSNLSFGEFINHVADIHSHNWLVTEEAMKRLNWLLGPHPETMFRVHLIQEAEAKRKRGAKRRRDRRQRECLEP